MNERPKQIADGDHDRAARRRWRRSSWRCSCGRAGVGLARRLLDDDGPAERRDARGDAELAAAVLVVYSCETGAPSPRVRAAANSGWPLMLRACATSAFLSGSPWATSSPSGATTMREAVLADADLIDHPPHFFEAELADEPAGGLVQTRQLDGEHAWSAADPRRRGSATSTTPSIVERRVLRESPRAAGRRGSWRSSRRPRRTA